MYILFIYFFHMVFRLLTMTERNKDQNYKTTLFTTLFKILWYYFKVYYGITIVHVQKYFLVMFELVSWRIVFLEM